MDHQFEASGAEILDSPGSSNTAIGSGILFDCLRFTGAKRKMRLVNGNVRTALRAEEAV
jgi:hypothetical protein